MSKYTHDQGAVAAAARLSDNVNPEKQSSGCQFYIVENPEGAHHLDKNYTVFGKIVRGIETVEKIASQPTNALDLPTEPIWIIMHVKKMSRKKNLCRI